MVKTAALLSSALPCYDDSIKFPIFHCDGFMISKMSKFLNLHVFCNSPQPAQPSETWKDISLPSKLRDWFFMSDSLLTMSVGEYFFSFNKTRALALLLSLENPQILYKFTFYAQTEIPTVLVAFFLFLCERSFNLKEPSILVSQLSSSFFHCQSTADNGWLPFSTWKTKSCIRKPE